MILFFGNGSVYCIYLYFILRICWNFQQELYIFLQGNATLYCTWPQLLSTFFLKSGGFLNLGVFAEALWEVHGLGNVVRHQRVWETTEKLWSLGNTCMNWATINVFDQILFRTELVFWSQLQVIGEAPFSGTTRCNRLRFCLNGQWIFPRCIL